MGWWQIKGIYDYFEDSLPEECESEQKHNRGDDQRDGDWYKLIPKRGWASPRIIQRLPANKINEILTMVRCGKFTLVELITHDIDPAEQAAKGIWFGNRGLFLSAGQY